MVMYEIWSLGHKPFDNFTSQEVGIIECDSTLYVGMMQKKNGGLYRTYITFSLKYPYI